MIVTPVSAKSATLRVSHGGTARPGERGNLCVELADRATEFTPPGGYATESVRRLAVER